MIVVYDYIPGQVGRKEYVVGRFNVPGEDPKNSKGPALITEGHISRQHLPAFTLCLRLSLV